LNTKILQITFPLTHSHSRLPIQGFRNVETFWNWECLPRCLWNLYLYIHFTLFHALLACQICWVTGKSWNNMSIKM